VTSPHGYGRGSIITPEAVLLDFEVAGLGSRSIAFAIDFAVQLIALIGFFAVLGVVAVGSSLVGIIVLLVGLMAIVLGYPIAMEMLNGGRTLGRMAVGTRVVTVEGAPVQFRQAFIRSLLALVDLYGTAGTVAVVSSLLTKRGQRLGDLVAGTMVIRQPKISGSAGAIFFWPPQYLRAWSSTVDTAALGNDVYQMIRDFLTRTDLAEPTRSELALALSDLVEQRLPLAPRGTQVPPQDYLTAIAAATQDRDGTSMPPPPRAGTALPPPPVFAGASARGANPSPLPPPPASRPVARSDVSSSMPPPPQRQGGQPPAPTSQQANPQPPPPGQSAATRTQPAAVSGNGFTAPG